jgi:hypothetical protein
MRSCWLLSLLLASCALPESLGGEGGGGKADGAISEDDFWGDGTMYFVRIDRWDPSRMTPDRLRDEVMVNGSEVRVYRIESDNPHHCPDGDVDANDLVFSTNDFSLRTQGNLTNGTPKSSYKIGLENKDERLYDMKALLLKSMWNDVSHVRSPVHQRSLLRCVLAARERRQSDAQGPLRQEERRRQPLQSVLGRHRSGDSRAPSRRQRR